MRHQFLDKEKRESIIKNMENETSSFTSDENYDEFNEGESIVSIKAKKEVKELKRRSTK